MRDDDSGAAGSLWGGSLNTSRSTTATDPGLPRGQQPDTAEQNEKDAKAGAGWSLRSLDAEARAGEMRVLTNRIEQTK